jgi:hypothetical protein
MRKLFPFLILPAIILFSCDRTPDARVERDAWVPIYSENTSGIKAISVEPPRNTVHGGKINVLGSIIYQVEQDSGIHVINAANPSNPQKLGFIRSFLCKELSVKNGRIYTNNFSDLVVIDASNINDVREVARTTGVFPDLALQYPEKESGATLTFFQCPDPKKGIVIGWEKKSITNANCWR